MDCIPQYGLGKAEFTITTTAPDTFPTGYNLVDGHQSVTSSVDTAAAVTYFGADPSVAAGGFLQMATPTSTTTSTQVYGFPFGPEHAIFPVASVGKLTTTLPDGCFSNQQTPETYAGTYVVTFKPTTTTFTETIGGKTVTTTVTTAAAPLELGLNFATGALDPNAPLCAASGGNVFVADSSSDENWTALSEDEATLNAGVDQTLDPSAGGDIINLGSSVSTVAGVTVTPTTGKPTLALTGVDARPAGIIGGGLLAVGAGLFFYGRTRRRAAKRQ